MRKVKVELVRKVKYQEIMEVSEEEYDLIKDLNYDDVEMYDFKKAKNIGNGMSSVPTNEVYSILEFVDSQYHEIDRDETMYDVTVRDV